MMALLAETPRGVFDKRKGVDMKLWYDDKKIPTWVEALIAIVLGITFGLMFGIGVLGISLGQYVLSLFN
jgi:hypothetical protein